MTNGETETQVISNPGEAQVALLSNLATKRANAHPLPGPLKEAFCAGPIKIAEQTVYQVVPIYFKALICVDSPIISIIQDVVQNGKVDTDIKDEKAWEVCWIFTHTPKDVIAMISKGPQAIKDAAIEEVGSFPSYPVSLVMAAIFDQIKKHLATAVKHGAQAAQEGSISFFRDSVTPLNGETDGFSNTLAHF